MNYNSADGKKGNWLLQRANKEFMSDFTALNYKARTDEAESLDPKEIIERIDSIKNLKYKAILSLAAVLGKRISEVCSLQKKDITAPINENMDQNDLLLKFRLQTKKWREGRERIIPITASHNRELLALLENFLQYRKKINIENLDNDAYIFGDPGFFQTTRNYWRQKHDDEKQKQRDEKRGVKILKTEGTKEYVKVPYPDNHLRLRVYTAAIMEAGINPHLLRHWRASFIGHSKKEEFQGRDRLLLIQAICDFKKLESAERYLRSMTEKEMKEVF